LQNLEHAIVIDHPGRLQHDPATALDGGRVAVGLLPDVLAVPLAGWSAMAC